jgi:TolB-like protein
MAPPPDSGAARADEGFWVAVLPFKHGGSNADLAALVDGLTDDTITGLSKFSISASLPAVPRRATWASRWMSAPPARN